MSPLRRLVLVPTLILATLAEAPFAEGFPASQVTLIENIPLSGFPSNPSSANDCWGYISPSGREYALIGLRNAVAVVDMSDPSGLKIVGSVPHSSSNWCDIRTYGHYAYAVNETGGGLDVIDLSQVDQGIVTLVQRVTEDGLQTCHNIAVNVESATLYLASPNINQGRLVSMDLTDPSNPVISGYLPFDDTDEGPDHDPVGLSHDVTVVTYDSGPYAGREIAFSSSGTAGFEIYDVTDKSNMFLVSLTTYPNHVYTHQAWLTDDYRYLYINDEVDNVNETVIMDVANIAAPFVVNTYTSGVPATDHNVFYHQGRVYEAEYRAGMRVFDASDPVNPVQIGWIDTFPGDDSAGSGGVWGVWPFYPSGKVIISDKNRGLFVVWPGPPPIEFTYDGGRPPALIRPEGDTFDMTIRATSGHQLDELSAVLVYDEGNGPVETPMTPLGGDRFRAWFGPTQCGAFVQYHVRAVTTSGIPIRAPLNAPCESRVAISARQAQVVLADQFEATSGWTVGGPEDNAIGGIWTRVEPLGNDVSPETDHTGGLGQACYITGQEPFQGATGDNDVDQGRTTLTSPILDLSGQEQATIAYWRWFHNSFSQSDSDEGNGPNEDILRVHISNDGGATWTVVENVGPTGAETGGGWFLHAFDAGSLVELTSQVRLRFIASDLFSLSVVEAAVDDLMVVSVGCDVEPTGVVEPGDRAPLALTK